MPRDAAEITNDQRALGDALREAREKAGLTQAQLAVALGHEYSVTVHRWERGERAPALWQLPAIARALGISSQTLAKRISDKISD